MVCLLCLPLSPQHAYVNIIWYNSTGGPSQRNKRQTNVYSTPTTAIYLIFSTRQSSAVLLQLGNHDNDHATLKVSQ